MLRKQVYILLFILIRDSSCIVNSLYKTGEEIWKLYLMIDRIEFDTSFAFKELFIGDNGANNEITQQLAIIHERFDDVKESMDFGLTRASFKPLPSYINLFRYIDRIEIFFQNIDRYHDEFHRFITGRSAYSDETFQNFTRVMIMDVEGTIQMLRKIFTDDEGLSLDRKNLISLIGDYVTSQRAKICNGPQIISNILVRLFETVMLAEMKSNLMLSFANIYQYIEQKDVWKLMNSLSRMQFAQQFGIYVNLFATNLIESDSSYLRACDPKNGTWTRNYSFYELDGTIQATIFRYHWPPCKFASCNVVWSEKSELCLARFYNNRSACPNTLVDCTQLKGIEACELGSGPHRFQYVNSIALGFLGRDIECPKDNGHMIRDGTDWSYTHKVCACSCYGDGNKISLVLIESNVKRNMVIIGVRFLRKDQILYIQPREGKLGKHGRIIPNSARWVSIPRYIRASDIHPVNRMNRVFFLDDLRLPMSWILTGVKFSKVQRENVKGFAIVIFGSLFDYQSGKINNNEQFRISEQALNDYPGKPLLFTAMSSAYTNLTQIVTPEDIKHVTLERSILEDDFGQSTLPLFDAVQIRPNPPSPLGGIGIFHKGVEDYAGFISLRVYGINHADYFKMFKRDNLKDGRVNFRYL